MPRMYPASVRRQIAQTLDQFQGKETPVDDALMQPKCRRGGCIREPPILPGRGSWPLEIMLAPKLAFACPVNVKRRGGSEYVSPVRAAQPPLRRRHRQRLMNLVRPS